MFKTLSCAAHKKMELFKIFFLHTLLLIVSANSFTMDTLFLQRVDSILTLPGDEQKTLIESREEDHTIYQTMTTKIVNHPYATVTGLMEKWYLYTPQIKYLRRAIPITMNPSDSTPDLIFMEIGVWLAVSWFMGKMTITHTSDSSETHIRLKQYNDPDTYKKWRHEARGLFKVEYHDFLMWYRLTDMKNGKTRITLVGCVEPKVWIPTWLFNVTAKKIFCQES